MLRCLKKIFLYRTGNYDDTESPKASEPLNGVYARVEREVELFKKDMSKSIKEIQKKCKKKLTKLCLLQEEEKQRLKADIEEEKAKFEERYKIKSAVIRSCSPNDVIRIEKLRVLNIEYEKGFEELKCQHETKLKDLEAKQSADKQKFQDKEAAWVEDVESWAQNELLKIVASKELATGVESFQTCGQVQPDNGLKNHFAEGKGHDDNVKAITETVTENSPLSDKRIDNRAKESLLDREEGSGLRGIINNVAVNSPSSRTVNVMDHPEQVRQFSIDSTPDHEAFEELQRSSEQPELVSTAVDVVPANQSNQASLIVKPVNQVLSAELPSSHLNSTNFCLATEVEHQPTVVPNQDMQSDSNLEHSRELVVHPVSNSDPNTVTPSEVRMQSENTINSSIPLEISYQHMEAETQSASRKPHLSYYDPLKIELDRIRKVADQTMKIYEEKVSSGLLIFDCCNDFLVIFLLLYNIILAGAEYAVEIRI